MKNILLVLLLTVASFTFAQESFIGNLKTSLELPQLSKDVDALKGGKSIEINNTAENYWFLDTPEGIKVTFSYKGVFYTVTDTREDGIGQVEKIEKITSSDQKHDDSVVLYEYVSVLKRVKRIIEGEPNWKIVKGAKMLEISDEFWHKI